METGYDVMSIEKMGKKERKKLYYIETKQKKRKNRALRQQRWNKVELWAKEGEKNWTGWTGNGICPFFSNFLRRETFLLQLKRNAERKKKTWFEKQTFFEQRIRLGFLTKWRNESENFEGRKRFKMKWMKRKWRNEEKIITKVGKKKSDKLAKNWTLDDVLRMLSNLWILISEKLSEYISKKVLWGKISRRWMNERVHVNLQIQSKYV